MSGTEPEEECIHLLPPSQCSICLGHGITDVWVLGGYYGDSPEVRARFDGHCLGCNLPVMAGQFVVRWVRSGRQAWLHSGCRP